MENLKLIQALPEHSQAIADLMNESRKNWPDFKLYTAEEIAHELLEPQENCEILIEDSEIIAALWWQNKDNSDNIRISWPYLSNKAADGLLEDLIKYAENKAKKLSKSITISLPEERFTERKLIEGGDYQHIRSSHSMCLAKREFKALSQINSLGNLEIKFVEAEIFCRLHNIAFADHYGFSPTTLEKVKHWYSEPNFDQLDWQGLFLDGQPVGYYTTALENRKGWIHILGVIPQYRRRGLSKILLNHACVQLFSRGVEEIWLDVDTQNINHALEIYQSVGFVSKFAHFRYLKNLKE